MCSNQVGLAWRGEGAQTLSLGDLDGVQKTRKQRRKGEMEALTLRKGLNCEGIVELWSDDDLLKCHIINIAYLALTYLIMPLRWHSRFVHVMEVPVTVMCSTRPVVFVLVPA